MKKLMVIAAVALCAIGANAATVGWNFSEVVNTAKEFSALNGYTAYFFTADAWSAVTATASQDKKISVENFKGFIDSEGISVSTVSGTTTYSLGGRQDLTNPTPALKATDAYYIVIADTDAAGSSIWAKQFTGISSYDESAEIVTPTDPANWNIIKTNTGAYLKSSNANYTFADVPEPTSAMLLLLGVAGLALRRKQA